VFLNVSPSFRGDGAELRQATNVVRAARASGTVTTLVYTNVCAIDQREKFPGWYDGTMSGIMKGYFESKAAIEDLVRSVGFMYWTVLRPPVRHRSRPGSEGRRLAVILAFWNCSATSGTKISLMQLNCDTG
jgi:uncharacterized protein YbjT (DUF2867 family)